MASKSIQRPTDYANLTQWNLYNSAPKERRNNVVSQSVTIFGEAPSGSHEAEDKWLVWKETRQTDGQIIREYAQDGANNLRWIHNTLAFLPVPDQSGKPYFIQLDNQDVIDGMVAGMPVANILVFDINDSVHTIVDVQDPSNKFNVVGSVLYLTDTVQLIDVAYPLKLKAIDPDGNIYEQWFTITVRPTIGTPAIDFIGQLNKYSELLFLSGATAPVLSYTLPANRGLVLGGFDCFGDNLATYEIRIDGVVQAKKSTSFNNYETRFDFTNYNIDQNILIEVWVTNNGPTAEMFSARLQGFQYAL